MANKVFRFALGSASAPCSGRWRVWTHEDEVHLAVRSSREAVTLTAYPTGRWRITIGPAVSRWTRPKEFRPGWTHGPDLVIPYTPAPLRAPDDDPYAAEPLVWLPAPLPQHQARFTLLLASPRAEASRWRPPDAPDTHGIAILPLRTAGALHLCRADEPVAAEPLAAERLRPGGDSMPGTVGLEVIVSADQAGRPSLWEVHEG